SSTTAAAHETQIASASLPNPFAKLFGAQQDEPAQTAAATTAPAANPPARSEPRPVAVAAQKTAPKIEKSVERLPAVAAVPQGPTPAARPAAKTSNQPTQTAAPAQPATQPATYEVASASSRPVQLRPVQQASLVSRGEATNAGAPAAGTPATGSSANDVIS